MARLPGHPGDCDVCGRALTATYIRTESGQAYCDTHGDPARCRICLSVIPLEEQSPCRRCRSDGYKTVGQARPSITRVLDWLEVVLGPHRLGEVPVRFTDGLDFGPTQSGATMWRFDGRTLNVWVDMLISCPPRVFEQTFVHEIGHVLLVADPGDLSFTGGLGAQRLREEEGFCEVLRYLWLSEGSKIPDPYELGTLQRNPDPIYGDGFRDVWNKYQQFGSVIALRDSLLGRLTTAPQRNTGSVPPITPVPKPVAAAPTAQVISPGSVIEGGSHRPTIDIFSTPSTQSAIAASSPQSGPPPVTDSGSADRPTIVIGAADSPAPSRSTDTPRPTRPIINLD